MPVKTQPSHFPSRPFRTPPTPTSTGFPHHIPRILTRSPCTRPPSPLSHTCQPSFHTLVCWPAPPHLFLKKIPITDALVTDIHLLYLRGLGPSRTGAPHPPQLTLHRGWGAAALTLTPTLSSTSSSAAPALLAMLPRYRSSPGPLAKTPPGTCGQHDPSSVNKLRGVPPISSCPPATQRNHALKSHTQPAYSPLGARVPSCAPPRPSKAAAVDGGMEHALEEIRASPSAAATKNPHRSCPQRCANEPIQRAHRDLTLNSASAAVREDSGGRVDFLAWVLTDIFDQLCEMTTFLTCLDTTILV